MRQTTAPTASVTDCGVAAITSFIALQNHIRSAKTRSDAIARAKPAEYRRTRKRRRRREAVQSHQRPRVRQYSGAFSRTLNPALTR
jgi:hypothetical protein